MSASYRSSRILRPGSPGYGRVCGSPGLRSLGKLSVAASLLLTLAATSSRARAETDLLVALQYNLESAAQGCWDEAEFRRNVSHRIGHDPFREGASLTVQVRVGGSARGVFGQIDWRTADGKRMGERRFIARDGNCAKLLTEMSFAVGLQIELLRPREATGVDDASAAAAATLRSASMAESDSGAQSAKPAVAPPPASAPPELSPANPPLEEARRPSISRRTPEPVEPSEPPSADLPAGWSAWLGLGPSLAWRMSPSATGDLRLFFGTRLGDLSLEIAAEASYPSTQRQSDGSGFRQNVLGGTIGFCGHHEAMSACALGRASEVRVTGLGVDKSRSPTGFVAQAGLRLAGTLELGARWFLSAHLDALGLLTSCAVKLNEARVWEMPRLGALVGLDLAVRFR